LWVQKFNASCIELHANFVLHGGLLFFFISLSMKTLVWTLFVLFTLLWTGLAAVSVSVSEWLLSVLASGAALTGQASTVAIPAWLQIWVDPQSIEAMGAMLTPMLETLSQLMPSSATLGSVVSVLVWGVWGIGAACMLVAAIAAHWFLGRRRRV
jgi:hypothetical protein